MQQFKVNFDFEVLKKAFPKYIREEAIQTGTTIVYLHNGIVVEENPLTGEKKPYKSRRG